eukprot:m.615527 g.615527  ORF g.615527 m.615527 type:complete len:1089 (+) comp22506_c0_seq2:201-3467(+)
MADSSLFDDDDGDEWVRDGVKTDSGVTARREPWMSMDATETNYTGAKPTSMNPLDYVETNEGNGIPTGNGDESLLVTPTTSADRVTFQHLLRTHLTCRGRSLGCSPMDAPNSKSECQRIISRLSKVTAKITTEESSERKLEQAETAQDAGSPSLDDEGKSLSTPDGDQSDDDTATTDADPSSILLCIPRLSGGLIYVVEKGTYDILASYKIKKILFCTKGDDAAGEDKCMAFTFHTNEANAATAAVSTESKASDAPASFMCHVFQFATADKTEQALKYIAQAFGNHSRVQHVRRRAAGSGTGGGAEESMTDALHYTFDLALSTAERDAGKMTYVPCVYTRDTFKVKSLDDPLQFSVTLTQTSVQPMLVEQGFGLLVGLGQADPSYSAIQMLSCKPSGDKAMVIVGTWSPPPDVLSECASNGETLALSLAVDVALTGVTEPLRIELKVAFRLVRHLDRVSFLRRATGNLGYGFARIIDVQLEGEEEAGKMNYSIASVNESLVEKFSYLARLSKFRRGHQHNAALGMGSGDGDGGGDGAGDDGGGGDDERGRSDSTVGIGEDDLGVDSSHHVLSGMGRIDRQITENAIEQWSDLLVRWNSVPASRIRAMARKGIPDVLRHQVWKRLVGTGHADNDLVEAFPQLSSQNAEKDASSAVHQQISWDLARTFPGNEFFQEEGGQGQKWLYRICKAYAVYDEEISYCQGLSFIAAVLLLHMPEEEAFVMFIKLMFDYNVREMFKSGFADLQLKFFQLDRLIDEMLPDLHAHFKDIGVETHMYASQWFLTLFAAKFPLLTVYHVLDVLFSEGLNVLFHVSIGLLKIVKKDLLTLEFEEVLQYFRISLPRRFCDEASARVLISTSMRLKVTDKRLHKYELEYFEMKAAEAEAQDPLTRLEEDNGRLRAQVLRLEAENEDMANSVVSSKIESQTRIEELDIALSRATKEVERLTATLASVRADADEDKERLEHEAAQVKSMYRSTLDDHAAATAALNATHAATVTRLQADIAQCETDKAILEKYAKIGEAHAALAETDASELTLQQQVHDLEVKLAEERLAVTERDMKIEEMEQQLQAAMAEIESSAQSKSKGKWFKR